MKKGRAVRINERCFGTAPASLGLTGVPGEEDGLVVGVAISLSNVSIHMQCRSEQFPWQSSARKEGAVWKVFESYISFRNNHQQKIIQKKNHLLFEQADRECRSIMGES